MKWLLLVLFMLVDGEVIRVEPATYPTAHQCDRAARMTGEKIVELYGEDNLQVVTARCFEVALDYEPGLAL